MSLVKCSTIALLAACTSPAPNTSPDASDLADAPPMGRYRVTLYFAGEPPPFMRYRSNTGAWQERTNGELWVDGRYEFLSACEERGKVYVESDASTVAETHG